MTPSPPTSPSTPFRRRKSLRLSAVDGFHDSTSPGLHASGITNGSNTTTFSRRSSRTSQTSYPPPSPGTLRALSSTSSTRPSIHGRKSSRASVNSSRSIEQGGIHGGGNLADELEQAWDEEEDDQGSGFLDGLREGGDHAPPSTSREVQSPFEISDMHDFGFGMNIHHPIAAHPDALPVNGAHHSSGLGRSDTHSHGRSGHHRHESAYDGSDYGPDSDTDEPPDGLPPLLRKRIRDVEALTRSSINTDDTLSEGGGVVRRTIQGLKDLGPQGNVEYGVTRLVTAYTSMATHRTHKTRDLFTQSHSLLYGGIIDLPEEVINVLLSEIDSLASTTSFLPTQNPLLSLQILASQTSELTYTLRSLTDLLQESGVAATAANRKLKNVKDMVEDLRLEDELVENSIMLIQAGDWDRRCRQRQAAKTCREVVEGFASRWGLSLGPDVAATAA